MFTEAFDIDTGLAVWLFSGPSNDDDDYAAYVASIRRLTALMTTSALRPAALQVVDDGNPIPGPAWRRSIAEASTHVAPTAMFGLVSASSLVRGVVVAINWIRSPPYAVACHATFDEGVAWIERARGPAPALHRLLAEARRRAAG